MNDQEQLCINAIRMLAIDSVQRANSGHPGMPLGAATMVYVPWARHLRHNPRNPAWPDPSASRATRRSARDAEHDGPAAERRHRNRRGVAGRAPACTWPCRTCVHTAETSGAGSLDAGLGVWAGAGRVHPRRGPCVSAGDRLDRHGLGSRARAEGARAARRRRDPQPGRVDALLGTVRRSTAVLPRRGPAAERAGAVQHRGRSTTLFGWERYVGPGGAIIGVGGFGASAPGPIVMRDVGFTPEHIVETAKALLNNSRPVHSPEGQRRPPDGAPDGALA